ncbi:class I SAM-dependent methyltransferase [Amycolatopsis pigmentata]|uniref:Class I SAM-dependent methyltransferase n=1 Tax=Amycolatopsis pigmentata TaxID=450801 RepID=A0ABW5FJ86_9PSEU
MPDVTADGCPIEVYTLLRAAGEPEIVHAALPAGAGVLDLGCGTGRIARALTELGHPVLAVDESPEMLAHLRDVETIRARIQDLRLDRRFGGVLLASHLINHPSAATRHALLATAAHHLEAGGRLIVEWHPPEWFDQVADGDGGQVGPVLVRIERPFREGDLLSATVRYSVAGKSWSQSFTARRLSEAELNNALAAVGLVLTDWCTADHAWFSARRVPRT